MVSGKKKKQDYDKMETESEDALDEEDEEEEDNEEVPKPSNKKVEQKQNQLSPIELIAIAKDHLRRANDILNALG